MLLLIHFGINKLNKNFDICFSNIRHRAAVKTKDEPIISKGSGTEWVNIMLTINATIISVVLKVDTVAGGII